ncbi:hypothetical protein P154DRAFT_534077 [Amniculicola lignicola CBS 123094]|uniref:F-box domain-containing protein n=1 Tax=Amniculicola lignicola CBS 123094 TaxID=1392246 RepID=A0A6A5WJV8_9PLEO|nr:hypothetical protein P154DRAFT_534077 [Amniculicola lignicola CBS 123094]
MAYRDGRTRCRRIKKRQSRRGRRASEQNPVLRLENGMICLDETPQHLVEVSKGNATDSLLLRLPSELRVEIFTFALTEDKPIRLRSQEQLIDHLPPCAKVNVSLLRVCRQIYADASHIYYAVNSFDFTNMRHPRLTDFHRWIHCRFPFQLDSIQDIRVEPVQYWSRFGRNSVRYMLPAIKKLRFSEPRFPPADTTQWQIIQETERGNPGVEIIVSVSLSYTGSEE